MTLHECRSGQRVTLREVTVDHRRRWHLAEWGFVPGAHIRLVTRGVGGGVIVAVGDARVALDARTAAAFVVDPRR